MKSKTKFTSTNGDAESIVVTLTYSAFGQPTPRLYAYSFNPCEEPFNVACAKFRDSLIYPANA